MNFKKNFLVLFLFVFTLNVCAAESLYKPNLFSRALGYVSQSRPICLFDKHIMSNIFPIKFGNESASQQYIDLGKEAQDSVGIPQERQVPIKSFFKNMPFFGQFAGAVAEPDAICVNEEKLNQQTYGARRFAMFHEAVHEKYNDLSVDAIVELVAMIVFMVGAHKLIKAIKPKGRFKALHVIAVIAAGFVGGSICSSYYHKFFERRADTQGIWAAACHKCAQEVADRRRVSFEQEKNPLRYKGYLWANDFEQIAQELQNQGKLCSHHKNN